MNVYIKDAEGFVTKKLQSQIEIDEVIVGTEEFEQVAGIKFLDDIT